jgi:hypothetical protein
MITEVSHEVDARGYYNGYFEAIAADTGFIPRPEFKCQNLRRRLQSNFQY